MLRHDHFQDCIRYVIFAEKMSPKQRKIGSHIRASWPRRTGCPGALSFGLSFFGLKGRFYQPRPEAAMPPQAWEVYVQGFGPVGPVRGKHDGRSDTTVATIPATHPGTIVFGDVPVGAEYIRARPPRLIG